MNRPGRVPRGVSARAVPLRAVLPILALLPLLAVLPLLAACGPAGDPDPPCVRTDKVAGLVARMDADRWLGTVAQLSGARPVTVGGEQVTIATRYTQALFDGVPEARAFAWVVEQLGQDWPADAIVAEPYPAYCVDCQPWQNLSLVLRGSERPDEWVLLTAHLDSKTTADLHAPAPGANDNATGAASLLELATVLPGTSLRRSLRLVWFTGEEEGPIGSAEWVQAHFEDRFVAVVNLDTLGRDADGDRVMQVHAGDDPDSRRIAACMTDLVEACAIDLVPDTFVGSWELPGDNQSFWRAGIGAVMATAEACRPEACGLPWSNDFPAAIHTADDTIDHIDMPFAFDIARAAVATVLTLADR